MTDKWYDRMAEGPKRIPRQAIVSIPYSALERIITLNNGSMSSFGEKEGRIPAHAEWLRILLGWPNDCLITGLTTHAMFRTSQVAIRVESPAFKPTQCPDTLPEAVPVYRADSLMFSHWEGEAVESVSDVQGDRVRASLFPSHNAGQAGSWSEDRLETENKMKTEGAS
jgi:hypothetical protein